LIIERRKIKSLKKKDERENGSAIIFQSQKIDIGVNEDSLGDGGSMMMNLPFDHVKKVD